MLSIPPLPPLRRSNTIITPSNSLVMSPLKLPPPALNPPRCSGCGAVDSDSNGVSMGFCSNCHYLVTPPLHSINNKRKKSNNNMSYPILWVKKLYSKAFLPTKRTIGSAAWDLYCYSKTGLSYIICPGASLDISTGISIGIPDGCYGRLIPLPMHTVNGITIADTIINEDCDEQVEVILVNNGKEDLFIKPFDRIAQLIIEHYEDEVIMKEVHNEQEEESVSINRNLTPVFDEVKLEEDENKQDSSMNVLKQQVNHYKDFTWSEYKVMNKAVREQYEIKEGKRERNNTLCNHPSTRSCAICSYNGEPIVIHPRLFADYAIWKSYVEANKENLFQGDYICVNQYGNPALIHRGQVLAAKKAGLFVEQYLPSRNKREIHLPTVQSINKEEELFCDEELPVIESKKGEKKEEIVIDDNSDDETEAELSQDEENKEEMKEEPFIFKCVCLDAQDPDCNHNYNPGCWSSANKEFNKIIEQERKQEELDEFRKADWIDNRIWVKNGKHLSKKYKYGSCQLCGEDKGCYISDQYLSFITLCDNCYNSKVKTDRVLKDKWTCKCLSAVDSNCTHGFSTEVCNKVNDFNPQDLFKEAIKDEIENEIKEFRWRQWRIQYDPNCKKCYLCGKLALPRQWRTSSSYKDEICICLNCCNQHSLDDRED